MIWWSEAKMDLFTASIKKQKKKNLMVGYDCWFVYVIGWLRGVGRQCAVLYRYDRLHSALWSARCVVYNGGV